MTAALMEIEQRRWAGHPICPTCGATDPYFIEPENGVDRRTARGSRSCRRVWKCRSCRRQFTVFVGTPLVGTKIDPAKLLRAADVLAANPAISVRALARETYLSDGTAHTLRARLAECSWLIAGSLTEQVIADTPTG